MLPPPSRSTLFPYTTLFRSQESFRSVFFGASAALVNEEAFSRTNSVRFSIASRSSSAPSRRSEEHTSELQSLRHLVCRLLLEKKKKKEIHIHEKHSHTESEG